MTAPSRLFRTRSGERGFILAVVLWALAGMGALAAYIGSVADAHVERALLTRETIERELRWRSTEATLIYLMATNRMNYRGAALHRVQRFDWDGAEPEREPPDAEIWMDGTPYQGLDSVRFAVQDEGGLAPVNLPETRLFAAVLRHAGCSPSASAQLAARARDYVDRDQQLTLNGAERFRYQQQNRSGPPNALMVSPVELQQVLGFSSLVSAAEWQRLRPLLTTRQPAGYNFNTMPPAVIEALLGISAEAARSMVEARQSAPIWRISDVVALSGRVPDIDPMAMIRLPSSSFRLMLWEAEARTRLVMGYHLTPFDGYGPWRKDYEYWERLDAPAEARPGSGAAPPPAPLLQGADLVAGA